MRLQKTTVVLALLITFCGCQNASSPNAVYSPGDSEPKLAVKSESLSFDIYYQTGIIKVDVDEFDSTGRKCIGGDETGKPGKNWIDEMEVFGGSGADNEHFSTRVREITIHTNNGLNLILPKEFSVDLMEPNSDILMNGEIVRYSGAFVEENKKTLHFYFAGSDAGGGYYAGYTVDLESHRVIRTIGSEGFIEDRREGVGEVK